MKFRSRSSTSAASERTPGFVGWSRTSRSRPRGPRLRLHVAGPRRRRPGRGRAPRRAVIRHGASGPREPSAQSTSECVRPHSSSPEAVRFTAATWSRRRAGPRRPPSATPAVRQASRTRAPGPAAHPGEEQEQRRERDVERFEEGVEGERPPPRPRSTREERTAGWPEVRSATQATRTRRAQRDPRPPRARVGRLWASAQKRPAVRICSGVPEETYPLQPFAGPQPRTGRSETARAFAPYTARRWRSPTSVSELTRDGEALAHDRGCRQRRDERPNPDRGGERDRRDQRSACELEGGGTTSSRRARRRAGGRRSAPR